MSVTLAKTYRFNLKIYGPSGRVAAHSFTWGESYRAAVARVGRDFEDHPHVWSGHSFKVDETPVQSVPTVKVPKG
jgi:hypothetical protein